MGDRIRAFDWCSHPFGAPERWHPALLTALGICLNSSFPTAIYWGPDLRLLYNDAWSVIPAERHPWALGRPAIEVWKEIWPVVGPQFEGVLANAIGFSTYDQMLPMIRDGQVRETYWNYSVTQILDESGGVLGVFNQGNETTAVVLGARAKTAEIDRLRKTFAQAPGAIAVLRGIQHRFEIANASYIELIGGRDNIIGRTVGEVLPEVVDQGFIELLDDVYRTGKPYVGTGVSVDLLRHGVSATRILDFIYQPMHDAAGEIDGIFVQATDVTDRALAERALRQTAEERVFLDELQREIQSLRDAGDILAKTTEMTAKFLGASVCAYADMDDDEDGFAIRDDWAAPGSTSIVGRYRLKDFGEVAVRNLSAGRPLVINDNRHEMAADEAARFQAIGITATACMPLVKQGRLVALMAVHFKNAHTWTTTEIALIREVTERSWAHIERVGAERGAEESDRRYRTLFNSIDEGFCIIEFTDGPNGENDDYIHVAANPAYENNAGIPNVVGQRVRQMVPGEADGWIALYRSVLETGQPIRFEKELEATKRWLELAAFRIEPPECKQVAVLFKDISSRKRAEEAMRVSEARFRALVNATSDVIYRMSPDWKEMRHLDGRGYLTDTISPSIVWQDVYLLPEDQPRVLAAIDAAVRTKSVFELEHRVRRLNGTIGWTLSRAVPWIDESGEIVEWFGAASDITEARESREALQASEDRLRLATESALIGTWDFDPRTGDLQWDTLCKALFGLPSDAEVSYEGSFLAGLHPDDRERVHAAVQAAIAPYGSPFYDIEYRTIGIRDKIERWIAAKGGAIFEGGQAVRFIGTVIDISARKRAERRFELVNQIGAAVAAERKVDRIVQQITDAGVELTGAEYGAFFYNRVDETGESLILSALSGVPHDEFAEFPTPRNTPIFAPTFAGKRVVRSTDIRQDPHYGKNAPHRGMPAGHLPVVSYLAIPVVSQSGEVLGGLFFGHQQPGVFREEHESLLSGLAGQAATAIDNSRLINELQSLNANLEQRVSNEVAERTRAEEQLRQAQKMEAIGQLTGGIAHDFNNMLAVVIGALNLMQRRLERGETNVKTYVDSAIEGARRASSLTQRLLAFSRQQPLEPTPVDANKLVNAMTELLSRTLGDHIQVETVLTPGLWRCFVDPLQLESAVLNLAVNARDAMPDGGRLTIETGNASVDSTIAQSYEVPEGQYVLIAVTDSGTGMSAEVMARAFDPFFTTKAVGKGSGLGLSQVFGFVRQSGGHVKLYSEIAVGTTVKLYLPRHSGPEASADVACSPILMEGDRSEIILVVEDEERVRSYSVEALKELGYSVIAASCPSDALRIIENEQRVDLLFTDIVMPEMNGRQLAAKAKAKLPSLRILYTTGYTRNAIVHNGVLDPGTVLLQKPFTVEQLAAKVRQVLDS